MCLINLQNVIAAGCLKHETGVETFSIIIILCSVHTSQVPQTSYQIYCICEYF